MKRCLTYIVILSLLLLCGCSVLTDKNIETLNDWSFQYNKGTDDYSLFFAFRNKNGINVSSDEIVDIRIINSQNEELFNGRKNLTEADFGYYSNQTRGNAYLAEIRIPKNEIASGKSESGTVYFTVYKNGTFAFDECSCEILFDLPVKAIQITAEQLPKEVKQKDYYGSTESVIKITEVTYKEEKIITPWIKVIISGEKTYGNKNSYDIFGYKLYDSEGYMVNSGRVHLRSLVKGDKFSDDSITFYDLTPGETYTLKFYDYE